MGQKVKAGLFKPQNGKVSVFLTENWSDEERVECGEGVAKKRGKTLRGWAILTASKVSPQLPHPFNLVCSLKVEVDNTPPGHANIVDWPSKTDDILLWQKELAERSKPHHHPPKPSNPPTS